jgi:acyl-CoA synthetase (AMP-forming)/AMP-acid ligase II
MATQRLVHDSLLASAAVAPGGEAVVDATDRRTYAELLDDARRVARLLQDDGLRRGDRVVIRMDNTVLAAAAIFGVWLAGGVIVVVNPQTKADKLAFIVEDSEATFVLGPEVADRLATVVGAPAPAATIPLDLAALVYTSGTTGRPKAVMMSHGAIVFCVGSIAEYLRMDASDRILSVLPLAFTYGLSQLLLAVRVSGTLILERSFAFPAQTLRRLREERATVFPAVPTVFATILGMARGAPFESVRCLTNAAAGLPPAAHEGLREVFPGAELFRMYGQTECMRVCYLEPALIAAKPTSVGGAIPGTEALVLDADGQPAAPGEVGILHVRGPHVMLGYWRAPELTAHHLRPGPLPGERMLCTHDYFTTDADGALYFVDRSDDIIKTRGEKVSSVEVENALYEIDGISEAAVIGVPDDLLGQAVRAYVVLADGAALDERAIVRACRERLEGYMVPRDVVFIEQLPQTATGKVRKKTLVENLA